MNKNLLTLIFLFLLTPFLSAQNGSENGFPLINNYTPKEYGADTQNWAILQDDRGVMYFGNNLGLLEFDGADWKLYKCQTDQLYAPLRKVKMVKYLLVVLEI